MSTDSPNESLATFIEQRMTETFGRYLAIAPSTTDRHSVIAVAVMGAVAEQLALLWLALEPRQDGDPEHVKQWMRDRFAEYENIGARAVRLVVPDKE